MKSVLYLGSSVITKKPYFIITCVSYSKANFIDYHICMFCSNVRKLHSIMFYRQLRIWSTHKRFPKPSFLSIITYYLCKWQHTDSPSKVYTAKMALGQTDVQKFVLWRQLILTVKLWNQFLSLDFSEWIFLIFKCTTLTYNYFLDISSL